MGIEEIHKTYQFTEGDMFVIVDVDFFKRRIEVRTPFLWRITPWVGEKQAMWQWLKRRAIRHLVKQYGFENIIDK